MSSALQPTALAGATPSGDIPGVPIVALYGHHPLRRRLDSAFRREALPASLLLHGAPGVGKQRLALWLGQMLLCSASEPPCGSCQHCRYAVELTHPDLHWFFPRPRLKNPDVSTDEVRADYAEAIAERVKLNGLYAPPPGSDGLYVSTIHALLKQASISPAMARRKVFVVGDAERMVPQEGADQAANAFLKLLEEPLADTTIILTSSEPGALLPTIRSRVVSVRVPPLGESDVAAFVGDPIVSERLAESGTAVGVGGLKELVRVAGGAPGTLLATTIRAAAGDAARRLFDSASSGRASRFRTALAQGGSGARGDFSDSLDALSVLVHRELRASAEGGDVFAARRLAQSVAAIEDAKVRASGNVSPQLVSAALLAELAGDGR